LVFASFSSSCVQCGPKVAIRRYLSVFRIPVRRCRWSVMRAPLVFEIADSDWQYSASCFIGMLESGHGIGSTYTLRFPSSSLFSLDMLRSWRTAATNCSVAQPENSMAVAEAKRGSTGWVSRYVLSCRQSDVFTDGEVLNHLAKAMSTTSTLLRLSKQCHSWP